MKDTLTTSFAPDGVRPYFRTVVVDDSATLRENLCRFLGTHPLIRVVGTATQGNEALHMAELLRPDLVLMDLNMPLMDGLEATAILRRRFPAMRVIIMTVDDSIGAITAARAQGAHGFVAKARIMSDLMTEVGRVFSTPSVDKDRSSP